jgi:hypothetical protein
MPITQFLSFATDMFGMYQSKTDMKQAQKEEQKAEARLHHLENTRQEVLNPYAKFTTDLSGLAKDLSGTLTNPYAHMAVATQAAEMEIEQADISLANTLDTLSSMGASAGGATALAQAALQSKKGVSASIEKQETQNEQLKAQGEERLGQLKIQEGGRVQAMLMQEGQRREEMMGLGEIQKFDNQEKREEVKLDRASDQLDRAQAQADAAEAQYRQSQSDAMGSFMDLGSSLYGLIGSGGGAMPKVESVGEVPTMGAAPTYTPGAGLQGTGVLMPSDRRLKKNIKKIRKSASGLNIYSFEYIDESYGKGTYQGVMSDEIPAEAVINVNGYDRVDYSKIDVEFKQI